MLVLAQIRCLCLEVGLESFSDLIFLRLSVHQLPRTSRSGPMSAIGGGRQANDEA